MARCVKKTYLCQQSTADSFSVSRVDKPTRRRRDTEISDRMTLSRGLNSLSMSYTLYMPQSHHFFTLHDPRIKQKPTKEWIDMGSKLCHPVMALNSHQMRTATPLLILKEKESYHTFIIWEILKSSLLVHCGHIKRTEVTTFVPLAKRCVLF